MFSPDPAHGTLPARNPRRRQRTSEESASTKQTTKRRKRSSLTTDTFDPLSKLHSDGLAKLVNGHTVKREPDQDTQSQHDAPVDATSLAIRHRGSKRGEKDKRGSRVEDGIVQTKNDNYVVTQDPNIPEQLRALLAGEQWRVDFSTDLGYAAAFTRTHAIVWRYGSTALSTEKSKTLVIKLPFPYPSTAQPSSALPLGMLVHDSGAGELALLVVMPVTGQIVYWESTSSAANADLLRQKQLGVQGAIIGMLSGENITSITEAELNGFVLSSSTGRIFHLTVRDAQGRPLITSQPLRSPPSTNAGFLGGLKSVFSSAGWRREIAAVRATPLQGKSRRQCMVATTQGSFQVWDLPRHAPKTLAFEIETKDTIGQAIQPLRQGATKESMNEFRFFDFAIFPDREGREKDGHRLLVLAGYNSHGDSQTTLYSLVDIFIRAGSMDINAIHPISCYLEPPFESLQRQTFKPRVFLPRPIHTAFVVFDNAVVLVSLAEIETSPGSHLQLESHLLSDPYQDVVYLKQGVEYHIVGCAVELAERYERSSSIIFAVHSFGLNRMAAFPAKEGQSVLERAAINIRSRMEQNIFFGGLPHNLLDFRLGRQHAIYTDEEVDAAALEINKSILTSKSRYIPAITPSMDHQLKLRAVALADLIKFASQFHMKASTRWQLLWSAEKMATARAIWQSYSSNLASKDSKRRNLLPELLDMLCEDFKNENRPERGETDIVRHYLIHDISRIQMIVPWAQQAVEELYVEGVKDLPQQAYLISQANDIQICAMEAAFRFRETNAEQYGIPGESIVDGVYQGPYDDLPAIWTSIPETVVKVKELADLSREMAIRGGATDEEENGLSLVLLRKLAEDSPRLVHICCQVYEERCRWLNSRPDPERRAKGERLEATYAQVRHDLIVKLADIELSDEGVKLAEKYQDMQSLVDVLSRSTDLAMERLDAPGGVSDSEDEEINLKLALNKEKSESYFKTFGKKWADALFAKEARFGKASDLIGSNENIQPYFTQYLRERPSLARLGWINEVAAHSDFVRAANDLFVAQQQESNLWSKKVEVSLGKLALLAAEEQNEVSDAHSATKIRQAENGLAVMVIQEQLYEFIRPAIALAIDETAEVEIAMKTFGHAVREKPALQEVLTQDIERIVSRIVLGLDDLVDSMTLMNDDPKAYTRSAFSDRRFFLAFKLLQMAGMADRDPAGKELQDKMIWRRCMIQDDWEAINRTELKDDNAVAIETEATALFRTLKAGFQEGFFDRVPLPSPSSVLGAGTTTAGLRASSRYANAPDSVVEALAKDHGLEDQELDRALERGRLAMWWAGIVDGARASVGADADSAGEEMARTEERRRVLDERLGTGQVPTMGTYASAFLDDVDGEGDVVML